MDRATFKSKWANWKFIAFVVILIAIFIKFFVIDEPNENTPAVVVLDLEQVAFRNEKEVEAVLGEGKLESYFRDEKTKCEKCPRVLYREGKVDIIYINEIADRIIVRGTEELDFNNKSILGALNLKEDIEPAFEEDNLKRWDNYQKYTQISAFEKKGKIDYILVKAKEE
ncbi:hypothetical protein [Dyadobacter sandarakinus]|uniref:Uncharacterized protein n=1 Tax=Dyadobacter sandarakinus TaxID=2747268 RepID=A0ABX7IAR9_9BACT|nr:hypothetical protein [Dyadobacter sandarakinus]QRR02046.1 hypothetical protein HWI92_14590 [Dyadobacter sandarakinus]